jgi:SAM-dependent methyltransferase
VSGPDPAVELAQLRAELAELRTEVRQLRERERSPRFAAIYPDFEDRFRGSAADVRERLAVYLPEVRACVRTGEAGPRVLDLGPGRGEWLELLAEAGAPAQGVDDNAAMVEHLRGRGLDIVVGDAAEHLKTVPDAAVDVVTAFHVVEHLDLEPLLALLDRTCRVLRPGELHPKEDVDLSGLRLEGVGARDTALLAAALQKGLFGPQDYALLARTPAAPGR